MDTSSNFVSLQSNRESVESVLCPYPSRLLPSLCVMYYVYVSLLVQFSRVGLAISMYASSKDNDDGQGGEEEGGTGDEEQSFSPIRNSDLYPHKKKVVGKEKSPLLYCFTVFCGVRACCGCVQ